MDLKKGVYLFIFTIIMSLSVASCSDDDDKVTPPNNIEVNGTWKFVKLTSEVEAAHTSLTDSVTNFIDTMKVATKGTYVFKIDGTYESKSDKEGAEVVKGKYEVSGNKIILDNKTDAALAYTFANDTLKMTEDVKAQVIKDLKVSADSVKKANRVEIFYRFTR